MSEQNTATIKLIIQNLVTFEDMILFRCMVTINQSYCVLMAHLRCVKILRCTWAVRYFCSNLISKVLLYTVNVLWFSLMTELLQVRQELNDHMRGDIHEQQIRLKSAKLVYPIP